MPQVWRNQAWCVICPSRTDHKINPVRRVPGRVCTWHVPLAAPRQRPIRVSAGPLATWSSGGIPNSSPWPPPGGRDMLLWGI